MSNKIVLSICIPSYNRGHRAYQLVESILPLLEKYEEIELVVSDNGSVKNIEGYKKIEDICNERIKFNRFENNQFFWGNVNQVLKMATGEFALLISDEDKIVVQAVPEYIKLCNSNKEVSVIRSKSIGMYQSIQDEYAIKGVDAIKRFFLRNNYMSGVIYNRNVVTDEVLDKLYNKFNNNIAYRYYPHEVIDAYCVVNGDFISSEVILIEEGEAEKEQENSLLEKDNSYLKEYNTFVSRLHQHQGFVQVIKELWCADDSEKAQMFLNLINKTRFLYDITKSITSVTDREFNKEIDMLREECIDDLKYLNISVINNNIDIWTEFIHERMK